MASVPADPLAELARLEGVPSALAAARDTVDAVLRDRGRRRLSPEQTASALLAAARASAALEVDHEQRDWLPGTMRLYVEVPDLARLIRVAPGQAIARAHALLGRGVLEDDQLGRVRAEDDLGTRLASLQQTLSAKTEAPVIVVAGIAHAELLTLAPFVAGNGIVARAVEHLVLISGEVDPAAVIVPEAAHRALERDYRWALERYRTGTAAGVRDWLLHVAAAVSKGAELSGLSPAGRRPAPRSGPSGR
ncbi:oxidoreductase [Microlunatus elymi]|uniref:Oxidoreductase n=1 Tax=Microlunatus elymi TaxID=2596828 RepID=A0A516PV95_9ACTN|nr:Fic family protein [Microlunatus elymi]QDP95117.1 oxidoreductase [Microlunatus elymi]